MMTIIFLIMSVAILWGGWPLVARSAGEGNMFNSFLLSFMAVLPAALIASLTVSMEEVEKTSFNTIGKISLAGLMIGLGLIAFNLIAGSRLIEISAIVPIINTSMTAVTVIGGIWFFGESITVSKIAGVIFLSIGIFLLRPSLV